MSRRLRGCRVILGLLVLLLVLLGADAARANGRYSQAMQLALDPSDPNRLWLMTTYGLLASADRGRSWHWVCEEALGFSSGDVFDPPLGVQQDGTLLIGLLDGLHTSLDKGCSWGSNPSFDRKFVLDFSVDKRVQSRALALVSFGTVPDGATVLSYVNELWETNDNGRNFSLIANNIPTNMFITTLDSAPSEPNRLYISTHLVATGLNNTVVASLMRSRDRGKNWENLKLPVDAGVAVYIAAVHPTNPDIVYLRTRERGIELRVKSTLLYTENAGENWTEILSGNAPMLGFALSADGGTVAAGFGDPGDNINELDEADFGVWRSNARAFSFEKIFDKTAACLTFSPEGGLYVCSRAEVAGFDVGFLPSGSSAFQSAQKKREIAGPLACGAGSTFGATCTEQRFRTLCFMDLGCPPDVDAGTNDAGLPPAKAKDSSDCGCIYAGRRAGALTGLLLGSLACGGLLRRARRRRALTTRSCDR